jgi:hypothetical protein
MLFLLRDQHLKVDATCLWSGRQDPNWAFNSIFEIYIITLDYNSRIQKLWKSIFRNTEASTIHYIEDAKKDNRQHLVESPLFVIS